MLKTKRFSWRSLLGGCGRVRDEPQPSLKPRKKRSPVSTRLSFSDLSSSASPRDLSLSLAGAKLHIFTLEELKAVTQNFSSSNFAGEGGFGPVYKGVVDEKAVPGLKPQTVAVKLLDLDGVQGHKEWLTEVIFLGQLRHPHLVRLVGYCYEEEHRLLVYEFMSRGSLENHIFKRFFASLPWKTRIKIAVGAAKGLAFLHDAEPPVIYRDFKASNILLDSDYKAKLSDFGLAKDGPEGDDTHVTTRIMGTHGYAAPEYIMTGKNKMRREKTEQTTPQITVLYTARLILFHSLSGLGRPPDSEERRLQLRGGPAGAPVGEALRRQDPAGQGAEPRGVGEALPQRPQEARPDNGPGPRGPVLRQGRGEGGRPRLPVPHPHPQVEAPHERRRRDAGAPPGPRRRAALHLRLHRQGRLRREGGTAAKGKRAPPPPLPSPSPPAEPQAQNPVTEADQLQRHRSLQDALEKLESLQGGQ